jgi:release factor glutamine methyltransferase
VQSAVADHARSIRRLRRHGLGAEVVRRERVPFGPVMRARAELIRARGLSLGEQDVEELVVIRATRAAEQEASA